MPGRLLGDTYGHNNASHCRLGCFAVVGGDLRHYPFCPVVEGFIRSEGDIDVCLRFRNKSLGHVLVLHPVKFEAMVISSLWADIIFQAANSARDSSATGRGADFCSLGTGLYLLGSLSLIGL